jgi:hypothetical protein
MAMVTRAGSSSARRRPTNGPRPAAPPPSASRPHRARLRPCVRVRRRSSPERASAGCVWLDRHPLAMSVRKDHEPVLRRACDADGGTCLVLDRGLHDGRADALLQVHVDLWIAREKRGHVFFWRELRDRRDVDEDAHLPTCATRPFAHPHDDLVEVARPAPGEVNRCPAGGRGLCTFVSATEQQSLQLLFQLVRALADGGRGDVPRFRGVGDRAMRDRADEDRERERARGESGFGRAGLAHGSERWCRPGVACRFVRLTPTVGG